MRAGYREPLDTGPNAMTLQVLLVLGAATGWLAAVILRHDSFRRSLIDILIGAGGALAAYLIGGGRPDSPAITVEMLFVGAAGAAATVAAVALFRRQSVR